MLDINEAQQLMEKFIELREKSTLSNKDLQEFKKHEKKCIDAFSYLVTMRTAKYKNFSNYEDLNQEGFEALIKGMKNYNPQKGIAFWWFHKYIDTRISRCANLHTTIRYPLKVAKTTAPHKETVMPTLVEERYCPDKEIDSLETNYIIEKAITHLNDEQTQIINMAYGIDGNKPMSINKICKKLNISRATCTKLISSSLSTMKENITL